MSVRDNRNLWIDALESGEFKQGRDALGIAYPDGSTSHCCLGVLCEVYEREVAPLKDVGESKYDLTGAKPLPGGGARINYRGEIYILPDDVADWVGLRTTNGEYGPDEDNWGALTGLNDEGWTFLQIAHILRYPPQSLFRDVEEA